MILKGVPSATATCVVCISAVITCPALAQQKSPPPKPEIQTPDSPAARTQASSFPSDGGNIKDDHLTLRANAYGFKDVSKPNQPADKCAPQGSKLRVVQESNGVLTVQFSKIQNEARDQSILGTPAITKDAIEACPTNDRVNTFTS